MSDGGNATPGRRRPGPPGDDNQWVTRSQRPTPPPSAAPWERHGDAGAPASPPPPARDHSEEISVAELIAKVSGTQTPRHAEERTHHRSPENARPVTPPPCSATASRDTTGRAAGGRAAGRRAITRASAARPRAVPPRPVHRSHSLSSVPRVGSAEPAESGGAGTASEARAARTARRTSRARDPARDPPRPKDRHGLRARGRCADRGAGTGPHRRGMAMAGRQEPELEQGRGARPEFSRHPRSQRTIRRRELSDRRCRQPARTEQRHGRGHHRRCGGCALRHDHVGQHPGEPPTRCRRVLSA